MSSNPNFDSNQPTAGKKNNNLEMIQNFSDDKIGPDYRFVSYIGSGSYGHVCKAEEVATGRIVAIKMFSGIFKTQVNTLRLLREIRILTALKDHPKIIKILHIIPPKDLLRFSDLYIVMEFMDTDLSKIIKSSQSLSRLHVIFILYQILLATKSIHSAKVFHRDLKPQNILINEDCVVKVCDFGLSRGVPDEKIPNDSRKLTLHVVTRWYRAPEVIFLTPTYSSSIDIWSIGCIFAELLGMIEENSVLENGRMPLFPGISCFPLSPTNAGLSKNSFFLDQISLILHVVGTPKKIVPTDFDDCSAKTYLKSLPHWPGIDFKKKFPGSNADELDLLKHMLAFNPSERMTVDEALSHRYFKKVREPHKETCSAAVKFDFENKSMRRQGKGILLREIAKLNKNDLYFKKSCVFSDLWAPEQFKRNSENTEETDKRDKDRRRTSLSKDKLDD